MKIVTGNEPWHRAASLYVRMQVFVQEQNIHLEDEFDSLDTDGTYYCVIFDENQPIATGRYLEEDEQTIRPSRIAVLKEYRGKDLGRKVVESLEQLGRERDKSKSIIHADQRAIAFYEKLDYTICSDLYYEDNVACMNLSKEKL